MGAGKGRLGRNFLFCLEVPKVVQVSENQLTFGRKGRLTLLGNPEEYVGVPRVDAVEPGELGCGRFLNMIGWRFSCDDGRLVADQLDSLQSLLLGLLILLLLLESHDVRAASTVAAVYAPE